MTNAQLSQFVQDGFVKVEGAFSLAVAAAARAILWRDTGCDPEDKSTWTKPVVWLGEHAEEPFNKAANTDVLQAAFDQLVGPERWWPRNSLGMFPVRFPLAGGDDATGWHIDASFEPPKPVASYFDWRVNLWSKGRALLMLFLFSDVGENDAPTRIRMGSHLRVPRILEPAGGEGLSARELSSAAEAAKRGMRVATATGDAGTVYLCHPFLVHAGQQHRGTSPKFMAQPPLSPRAPLGPEGGSPVEEAIRMGLCRNE